MAPPATASATRPTAGAFRRLHSSPTTAWTAPAGATSGDVDGEEVRDVEVLQNAPHTEGGCMAPVLVLAEGEIAYRGLVVEIGIARLGGDQVRLRPAQLFVLQR